MSSGDRTPLVQRASATTRTRANYDRLASIYNAWASWEQPYVDAGFGLLALRPGEHFLEVGSATGALLARAAAATAAPDRRCVGVDLSPNMCAVARRHLDRELGGEHAVSVLCGDATEVLAPTGMDPALRFDAACVMFTLELFEDADMVLLVERIKQRLRPRQQSRLIVVSMSTAVAESQGTCNCRCCGCMMGCYRCCHNCCPCVVDCRPIDAAGVVRAAGLNIVSKEVVPMYGLSVELLEARLIL